MQPTNADILQAVTALTGKVEVALDRTVNHERSITDLSSKVQRNELAIAHAKGQSSVVGSAAAAFMVAAVEIAKTLINGGSHSS